LGSSIPLTDKPKGVVVVKVLEAEAGAQVEEGFNGRTVME
jgi:hypothetical protein